MQLLALSGSLRAASANSALLRALPDHLPIEVRLIEYRGLGALPHFNPDLDGEGAAPPAEVAALRAQVSASAGLIISSPEYAHGVPGSLKNALDWLVSYPDFAGKPVLLLNAARAGGQHAQASLAETLRTMSANLLPESLTEPFVDQPVQAGLSAAAGRKLSAALAALVRAAGG